MGSWVEAQDGLDGVILVLGAHATRGEDEPVSARHRILEGRGHGQHVVLQDPARLGAEPRRAERVLEEWRVGVADLPVPHLGA